MLQFRLPNAPGVSKFIRKKVMSECYSAPTDLRRRSFSGSSSPGGTNPGGGDSESNPIRPNPGREDSELSPIRPNPGGGDSESNFSKH